MITPTPTPLPANTKLKYFGNKSQLLSQTKVEDEIKMEFTTHTDVYNNRRRIQRGLSQPNYWAINRSKNLADPLIELSSGVNDTDNNIYKADSVYDLAGVNIGEDISGSIYMDNPAFHFSSPNKFSIDRVPKINVVQNRIKVSTPNNSREYERTSEILDPSNLEIVAESKKIKKVLNPSKLNVVTSGNSTVDKLTSEIGPDQPLDTYEIDSINLSNPPKFSISGAGVLYFWNSEIEGGSLKIISSGVSRNINYGLDGLAIPSCSAPVYDGDLIEFNNNHSSSSRIQFIPYSSMALGLYDKSINGIIPKLGDVSESSGDGFIKYELVNGDGSEDNSKFTIVNSYPSAYLVWNENSTGLVSGDQLSVRIRSKNAVFNTVVAENSIKFTVVPASNKTLGLPSNIHSTIQDKLIICRGEDFYVYSMYNSGVSSTFLLKPPGSPDLLGKIIDPYKQVNIKENLSIAYEFKILEETDWKLMYIDALNSTNTRTTVLLAVDSLFDGDLFPYPFTIPSCKDVQFRCYICDGKPSSLGPLGSGPYIYSDVIKFPSVGKLDCDDSSVFEPSNFYVSFDP